MASIEDLKATFFDECGELLLIMENGLSEIESGGGSEETIHALFRAVHSIKGGAGIFGLEALVEFAHVFETVFDELRNGTLSLTTDLAAVLLKANDTLSDLVGLTRSGAPIEPGYGSESRAALKQLISGDSGDDDGPAPADFEGIAFTPVRVDLVELNNDAGGVGRNEFGIVFKPNRDFFQNANEPLYVIRELRQLGDLDLSADVSMLPALSELQHDGAYIGWTGTLRTTASRAEVEQVFEFVTGDCELLISGGANDAVSASGVPTPAMSPPPMLAQAEPVAVPPPSVSPVIQPVPAAAAQPALAVAADAKGKSPPVTDKPTTRIDLDKIDSVVNLVGELVIAQAMLGQVVQGLPEEIAVLLTQRLEEVVHHTRDLKDGVMSMRAQPVAAVFQRMPRLVRELSAKTGKKVRLEISGEHTEVDRSIIERLSDPLTHIIRNAVDHGIETPAERIGAGKSEEGTIRLTADHRGGRIVIEISDDGAGINGDRVLRKAKEKGLITADAALNADEINNLIFLPGFSTAETVSDISGRGVGMDVVRRNVQDFGGRISLKSERGRGMTIQLALPLTLAVMEGMVIKVGRETYVMAMSAIIECLSPDPADVHQLVGTRGMLQLRGEFVPIAYLSELLNIASTARGLDECVVIVTDTGEGSRLGIVVDELCGHQQVVIKSIEDSYGSVPGVAAATILGNGLVAFILDVDRLPELANDLKPPPAAQAATVRRFQVA